MAQAVTLGDLRAEVEIARLAGQDAALLAEALDLLHVYREVAASVERPLHEVAGAPPPQLREGDLLAGRYQVERLLAQGGFASVYRARDITVAGRAVVIKWLDQLRSSEVVAELASSELQALARLHHPGIVAVSDAGQWLGIPYLILSYVPGQPLRELTKAGPMPWAQVRSIVGGVVEALAAAHEIGLAHLDVKPDNVIISRGRDDRLSVTLIDFGVARFKSLRSWRSGGSGGYEAPEQEEFASTRSDQHALAVMTVELVTGKRPAATLGGRVAELRAAPIPGRAKAALERALAADPDKRFATIEDFGAQVAPEPRPWSKLAAAGFLILLIGAALIGVLLSHWRDQRPFAYGEPVPLTTGPAMERSPSISADGRWIYYQSFRVGDNDLYRIAADGSGLPERLTATIEDDWWPTPSPDGQWVAFSRTGGEGETFLCLLRLGGEPECHRTPVPVGRTVWSPDGETVLVVGGPGSEDRATVSLFRVATRSWERLFPASRTGGNLDHPAIAPDGKRLAFVRRFPEGRYDILLYAVGKDLRPVAAPEVVLTHSHRTQSLHFSPDGRSLLYLTGNAGAGTAWRKRLDGGAPEQLPYAANHMADMTVAQRVWRIAYAFEYADENVYSLPLRPISEAVPLVTGSYADEEARRSPDGSRLAFSSGRSGSDQIWVQALPGGTPRRLTSFAKPMVTYPLWHPDGRTLLGSVRSGELGFRVFRLDPDTGGAPVELLRDCFATSFSRDGRAVYVRSQRSGSWEIWRVDYPGLTKWERVTSDNGFHAEESADGRRLLYSHRIESDGLFEMPVNGGAARRIIPTLYNRTAFSATRQGVYFARLGPQSKAELCLRTDDGSIRRLHLFHKKLFWGFDAAQDGSLLVYSQYDVASSDIQIIDWFR